MKKNYPIVDHGMRSLLGRNMALSLLILGVTLALGATLVAALDVSPSEGLLAQPHTSLASPSGLDPRLPSSISLSVI